MAAEAEPRGSLLQRYEGQRGWDSDEARLRAVCAFVACLASLAVMFASVPVPVFLVALLGLLLSVVWLFQARSSARRARVAETVFLAVHADGLLWSDPPSPPIWVSWSEVEQVSVDEERLTVALARKGSQPLHIVPRYPGVEIHELMRTLRNAWLRGCDNPEA